MSTRGGFTVRQLCPLTDKLPRLAGGAADDEFTCHWMPSHSSYISRANRTALDAFREPVGVCRDFAHLAITLCRCLNIPARYATGYPGDIGVPPVPDSMDFSAWFEAYLGGHWHTFDPRHNRRRNDREIVTANEGFRRGVVVAPL